MAYSVSLKLDKRKKNIANNHTIVLQIIVNRKMTSISTGHSVCEKDWDSRKREIKKTCKDYPNITRLNNILMQKKYPGTKTPMEITKLNLSRTMKNIERTSPLLVIG